MCEILSRSSFGTSNAFFFDAAKTMDALTTRALQAQVEAANVERENSNR